MVHLELAGYIHYDTPQTSLTFGHAPLSSCRLMTSVFVTISWIGRQTNPSNAGKVCVCVLRGRCVCVCVCVWGGGGGGGDSLWASPGLFNTYGNDPLNSCRFLVSDLSNVFASKPLIGFSSHRTELLQASSGLTNLWSCFAGLQPFLSLWLADQAVCIQRPSADRTELVRVGEGSSELIFSATWTKVDQIGMGEAYDELSHHTHTLGFSTQRGTCIYWSADVLSITRIFSKWMNLHVGRNNTKCY